MCTRAPPSCLCSHTPRTRRYAGPASTASGASGSLQSHPACRRVPARMLACVQPTSLFPARQRPARPPYLTTRTRGKLLAPPASVHIHGHSPPRMHSLSGTAPPPQGEGLHACLQPTPARQRPARPPYLTTRTRGKLLAPPASVHIACIPSLAQHLPRRERACMHACNLEEKKNA